MSWDNPLVPFPASAPQPAKARRVRVWFMDNTWVDYTVLSDFRFHDYITAFRSVGHIVTATTYIPGHLVKMIAVQEDDTSVQVNFNKPDFSNAPTTETKQ